MRKRIEPHHGGGKTMGGRYVNLERGIDPEEKRAAANATNGSRGLLRLLQSHHGESRPDIYPGAVKAVFRHVAPHQSG